MENYLLLLLKIYKDLVVVVVPVDNVEKCSKYRYIGVFAVDKVVDKKPYLSTQSTASSFSLLKALYYPQSIHRVIHIVGAVIHRVIHKKISKN